MSISRSVADIIRNHMALEVDGSDRMYFNVYQPELQTELRVVFLNPFTDEGTIQRLSDQRCGDCGRAELFNPSGACGDENC